MVSSPDDFSSWPPLLQWAAGLGAIIAGAIAWFLGKRSKQEPATGEEIARLKVEAAINAVRHDFEIALSETRRGFCEKFDILEASHHELREMVIRLDERLGGRRRT